MGILELSGHYDNSIHPLYSALSTFLRCRMASTVWKGHLTFGLVSLPIKLFTAARAESISFNQLHKDDHSRVRQVLYCQSEDKPIARSEIVKGYEYEKDRYIVVDDEDIKNA